MEGAGVVEALKSCGADAGLVATSASEVNRRHQITASVSSSFHIH
jgi:hypothetical protein